MNSKKLVNVIDLSTLVYGRVPPQSRELEYSVLGTMLQYPDSIPIVKNVLLPSDFYEDRNQIICKVIFDLHGKGTADILLTIECLKEREQLDIVGGPFFITQLTIPISSNECLNAERHCRIIKQKSIQRNLIKIAAVIINDSYEDSKDVFDILKETRNVLDGVTSEIEATYVTRLEDIAANIIVEYDRRAYYFQNNMDDPDAVYTGMPDWDRVNGRLFNGLYVVAARPGMGKGVHMTELACRIGAKHKVGIINGEMTHSQLLTRIGSNLLEVDNYLWKRNAIMPHDQEMVRRCMEASIQLKLFLDDNRDISRIANKIIQWKKEGVRVILADFLTAFTVPEDMAKYMNPRQQVNYILSTFVFLSKELGIPIILYAQLNRQNLQRKNGEPNLGDLKESGSIEEFAFQVSFLHRPEYYDPNASEDEWGEDVKGLMYQIIAKHRDGILDRIKYKAQLNLSKLYDWENSIQDKVPQWNPEAPAPFDGKRAASNDVFQGAIEFDKDDEPF